MSHDDLCAAVPRSLRVRGSIAIAGVRLPTTIFMVAVAALALSAALIVTGTPVSESLSIVAPPAAAAVAVHEVRWRGYGVIAVLLILILANFVLGAFKQRVDLTDGKLYTLSQGTNSIMGKLDGPVRIRYYFSQGDANVPLPLKAFGRRVEDLLAEYRQAGRGKVTVEKFDR